MDAQLLVTDLERVETRSGKTRWVLTDGAGREYTTTAAGPDARTHQRRPARLP